jgi:hypothetical protein
MNLVTSHNSRMKRWETKVRAKAMLATEDLSRKVKRNSLSQMKDKAVLEKQQNKRRFPLELVDTWV